MPTFKNYTFLFFRAAPCTLFDSLKLTQAAHNHLILPCLLEDCVGWVVTVTFALSSLRCFHFAGLSSNPWPGPLIPDQRGPQPQAPQVQPVGDYYDYYLYGGNLDCCLVDPACLAECDYWSDYPSPGESGKDKCDLIDDESGIARGVFS